ncbi:MAG: hypothetical protein R6U27_00015, partial [Desulfobacterales bacterium]
KIQHSGQFCPGTGKAADLIQTRPERFPAFKRIFSFHPFNAAAQPFFFQSGPKADYEIFNALRPRQSQFPDNKLFMISTAGAKQGLFFSFFDEGFKIQDRLTCQASTAFVNPLIPKKFLDKEKLRDPDNFKREFLAEFSEKLESFFTYELIQRPFTLAGDLTYQSGNDYYLGLDQSGVSGKDRFSLSIGHAEKETIIIDCIRSWATKDLDTILNEIEKLKNGPSFASCNCLSLRDMIENPIPLPGLESLRCRERSCCLLPVKVLQSARPHLLLWRLFRLIWKK